MKFHQRLNVIFTVIFCLGCSVLQAQEIDNRGSVYLGGIHYMFDDDRLLDNDTGIQIGVELPFTQRWSMALEHADFFAAATEQGLGDADLRYTRVGINYQLDWLDNPGLQPYAGVGFGGLGINRPAGLPDNYAPALDAGIGLKQYLSDRMLLRWDLKAIAPDGFNSTDFAFSLSVGYAFGSSPQRTPAPPAEPVFEPVADVPVDSDGDGIADLDDACPATPANRAVDARGCELDGDGDGIADFLDRCPDTPMTLAVDGDGCPILETSQLRQALDVRFEYDSATIDTQYEGDIAGFAEFLTVYANTSVVIEGHTDSMGSEQYNQDLSERRAMAVRESLMADHGIAAARISIIGFGESRPVETNETVQGRAQNRRIEAEVSVTVEAEVLR